jgi:phosphatidylserine decarboxylase
MLFYLFTLTFSVLSGGVIGENGFKFYRNGKIVEDDVSQWRMLKWLHSPAGKATLLPFAIRPLVSKVFGLWCSSSMSSHLVEKEIKRANIDLDEFIVPEGGFSSFNEFFIRKLRPGARKISTSRKDIISPADSKCIAILDVEKAKNIFIKDTSFDLTGFLCDSGLAKKYKNGAALIFRLSPYDYHRYHFPFDCTPMVARKVDGVLHSVSPITYMSGIMPPVTNKRHISVLKTTKGDAVLISVGALFVGKIVEEYSPELKYKKGDECGHFEFGGSTVVLIFEKDLCSLRMDLIKNSEKGFETEVKMGEPIAVFKG